MENNIIFNSARTGIDFNDGFGGRNLIKKNIILCNLEESEFQSKYKTDLGTKVLASSDEINEKFVQEAKAMLFSS